MEGRREICAGDVAPVLAHPDRTKGGVGGCSLGAQVLHPRNYAANGAGALVFRSSMYDGLPAERILLVDECEEQKGGPPKLEQGCVICSKEKGVDEKLNV